MNLVVVGTIQLPKLRHAEILREAIVTEALPVDFRMANFLFLQMHCQCILHGIQVPMVALIQSPLEMHTCRTTECQHILLILTTPIPCHMECLQWVDQWDKCQWDQWDKCQWDQWVESLEETNVGTSRGDHVHVDRAVDIRTSWKFVVTSLEVVVIARNADLLITRPQQSIVETFRKANAIEATLAVFITTNQFVETTPVGGAQEEHHANFSTKGHLQNPPQDNAPGHDLPSDLENKRSS